MSDVFVYGTLLLPELQRRVTGRTFEAVLARVHGFARRRVRGETYPSLVPEVGAAVDGALLRGVDDASLALLDAYEGEAYERIAVRVRCADGSDADASLWLLRASEQRRISDEPWDLTTFIARDLARFEAEYGGFDGTSAPGARPPG